MIPSAAGHFQPAQPRVDDSVEGDLRLESPWGILIPTEAPTVGEIPQVPDEAGAEGEGALTKGALSKSPITVLYPESAKCYVPITSFNHYKLREGGITFRRGYSTLERLSISNNGIITSAITY